MKNRPIVSILQKMAHHKNATPIQIGLAWLLAKKPFIVPIPGTVNLNHLDENNASVNVELTPEDMKTLEDASAQETIYGIRAPEMLKEAHDIGVNFGKSSKGTNGKTSLK